MNGDKIVKDMIGCKMISHKEEELIYRTEFVRFEALLQEWFPLIHKNCNLQKLEKQACCTIKGKELENPSVFMAHYDVVAVVEKYWKSLPLSGLLRLL